MYVSRYNFFENFGNGRNNRYWSIVVRVVPFALFEDRSYSSEFPLSWKNTSVNLLYKYLSERWRDYVANHFKKSRWNVI